MTVAFVAATTAAFVDSATSITGNAPSGLADGDMLLAGVFGRAGALTTPTGWTKVAETDDFTFDDGETFLQRLAVFSKDTVLATDSGDPFEFESGGAAGRMGLCYIALRDTDGVAEALDGITSFVDTWAITPPTATATEDGELFVVFASGIVIDGATTTTPDVPTSFTLASGSSLAAYRIGCAYRVPVFSTESNSGDFDFYPGSSAPTVAQGVDNGLGAITLRISPSGGASDIEALISEDTGPLGAPSVVGSVAIAVFARDDTGPLGVPRVIARQDFTGLLLGDVLTTYVMDLTTPGGTVRVPIRSWQATLQTERQSFVQCVVPACTPYVGDLADATAFTIFRRAETADGQVVEAFMAGAAISSLQTSRGPFNHTAVLQGYADAFATDEDPPATLDRTLQAVRFLGDSGGVSRVRCAIDWLLRPGQRALVNEDELIVGSISFYVSVTEGGSGDAYMEVAEQQQDG